MKELAQNAMNMVQAQAARKRTARTTGMTGKFYSEGQPRNEPEGGLVPQFLVKDS